jgi:energy-coupling factor transporter ATP-binding protein EcfA2
MDYLARIKGKKTIIIAEHGFKYIHLADRVIVIQDGFVVSAGKPEEVLKNIPKGMI